jgi:glycosyltransferase involved in cell wall biosynthesis
VSTDNRVKGVMVATSSPLGEEAIGKVALHLAEGLAKQNLLHRLLYVSGRPLPGSNHKGERIILPRIPLAGRFGWGRAYLQKKQDSHYQTMVARTIEKENPRLFYGWVLQSHKPLTACRRSGVRSVLECGFIHPSAFKEILVEEFKRYDIPLPWHLSDSRVRDSLIELEMTDNIVAPSSLVAESFVARGFDPQKFIVMPPGVDCDLYQPIQDFRQKKPWALYVGRLELAKGVHHVITAWQKVKGPNRRLILVGNMYSCLKRWLEMNPRMIDKSVEFAGVQTDLRPYFEKAMVTVLPSLADGFGMAVMEGMAAGLPAIITESCGVKMAVRNGDNGWVVPVGDSAVLAEKMEQAFANPSSTAKMGHKARQEAIKYSWDVFEQKTSILKDLC